MFFLKLNENDQLTNNFWVAQKETMEKLPAGKSAQPLSPSGTLQISDPSLFHDEHEIHGTPQDLRAGPASGDCKEWWGNLACFLHLCNIHIEGSKPFLAPLASPRPSE